MYRTSFRIGFKFCKEFARSPSPFYTRPRITRTPTPARIALSRARQWPFFFANSRPLNSRIRHEFGPSLIREYASVFVRVRVASPPLPERSDPRYPRPSRARTRRVRAYARPPPERPSPTPVATPVPSSPLPGFAPLSPGYGYAVLPRSPDQDPFGPGYGRSVPLPVRYLPENRTNRTTP